MNYERISQYIPIVQQLQQRTCEEIAISVDMNLEDYVQVSEKLDGLKDALTELETKFHKVEADVDLTKDTLQETIFQVINFNFLKQVNSIVENLKLIFGLEKNMKNLHNLLRSLEKIDQILKNGDQLSSFQLLNATILIVQAKTHYQENVDICPHCR